MGFYMRKSVSFGGVRFNFSKSGIGASVGVKGFRVGTGPRGNYVHMGRNGIYYRAALGNKSSKMTQSSVLHETSQQVQAENDLFQEIESGDIAQIVDASSQDLIDEINTKRSKLSFWPFALLLVFIPIVGIYVAIASAIIIYKLIDERRKTTILFYNIEEQTENEIQQFYASFDELMKCSSKWHISAQADVRDRKYHAGASSLVNRSPIAIQYRTPTKIKTNVRVPSIPVGKQTLYFFPDRLLIFERKRVGGLSYSNLNVEQYNQRFIELQRVPKDGTIVDYTWQYVNKSGAPDRRFKDNRRLPILLYSDIKFTSDAGLTELIELSKKDAGSALNDHISAYSQNLFTRIQ